MQSQHIKKILFSVFLSSFLIVFPELLFSKDNYVLQSKDVRVVYAPQLKPAAKEVSVIYQGIKEDLEATFGWKINEAPTVLLIPDRESFLKMIDNSITVAFASSSKNMIVIDYSKMVTRSFKLGITLKHELCHILLHQHIKGNRLPRWLNEGLAQWVSDGIAELIRDPKKSYLNKAVLSKKFIRFKDLQYRFPDDEKATLLAYEESKSFIIYLINRFGTNRIRNFLNRLKNGEKLDTAISNAFSFSLEALESDWHKSLRYHITWFAYLCHHIYGILFFFTAVITFYTFIRWRITRKKYWDEDDDDDTLDNISYYT